MGAIERGPFRPVTDLRAWSANDSSVGLLWSDSPDRFSFDAQDYSVDVDHDGVIVTTRSIPLDSTTVVVTPLTRGRLYRFGVFLRARDSAKDFVSGPPASILWATARRFTSLAGTLDSIRIPAFTTTRRWGLQLFDSTSSGPRIRDGALAEGTLVDVFFDAAIPAVRTGEEMGEPFAGSSTRFSTLAPRIAPTADEPLSFAPAADGFELAQVSLPLGTVGGGLILFGKTGSGNVFRLFLRRGANGSLIHGTFPNTFIEVEVSYQTSTLIGVARVHEN